MEKPSTSKKSSESAEAETIYLDMKEMETSSRKKIHTSHGSIDLQLSLEIAYQDRDLQEFEELLKLGADPNIVDNRNYSIYLDALSQPGCAQFIKLCLQYGCSANYIYEYLGRYAIDYATDSQCCENLEAILSEKGVLVNAAYYGATPLISLTRNMDPENVSEIIKCIRLLLDYGASPNIPDDDLILPLRNVLESDLTREQKSELVSLFLQYPNLDIDSFGGSLRKALLEFDAKLNLPAVRENADKEVNYHNLLYSMDKDIPLFKEMLPKFKEDKSKLLVESIAKGYNEALELLLLQSDLDINKPYENFLTFVEHACIVGNWFALEQLLKHEKLVITKSMEVLNPLVFRLDEPEREYTDYVKCFELVLASKYSRLHERDRIGRTPLHNAIYFHHDVAVKKLLQSGAYLGMRSDCKQLAVQDIKPELLEQQLDSCITSGSHSRAHDDYEIQLNYINFRLRGDSGLASEMQLICEMGKFAALRPLLQHPLISSFIMLKWHSLSRIFYIHFMLYMISSICLLTHLMLNYTAEKSHSAFHLFNVLSGIGLSYIALCELIGLFFRREFWSISKVTNFSMIALSINSFTPYDNAVVTALNILLIALGLTQMVGSLPVFNLSTHVLMLREVCFNFLSSCLSYSALVIAFALSFYVLNLHQLNSKGLIEVFIRTVILSTGEFNANEIEGNIYVNLFFLLFVILISIVLMNLLTALAIGDTQVIQAEAEVNTLICRARLLSAYEIFLSESWGSLNHLRKCFRNLMHIRQPLKSNKLCIKPNDANEEFKFDDGTLKKLFDKIDQKSKERKEQCQLQNIEEMLKQMLEKK